MLFAKCGAVGWIQLVQNRMKGLSESDNELSSSIKCENILTNLATLKCESYKLHYGVFLDVLFTYLLHELDGRGT
jgi:hypothetical protein